MANLAIKGHPTRGKEVIEILEMLGGKEKHLFGGNGPGYYYTDGDNNISYKLEGELHPSIIPYSLEEFFAKFPYKVGDKVNAPCKGCIKTITSMEWDTYSNTVTYKLDNWIYTNIDQLKVVNDLQPYKEETMEEKNNNNWAKWDLPDGYEFQDEEGNVIKTDVIKLVKKQQPYPKTYEECCELLFPNSIALGKVLTSGYNCELLEKFGKLLLCRDAYWKIAGEQMGLGKPWKPDWKNGLNKCCLTVCENRIVKNSLATANAILVFPTEEMRDAFFENFKDLIEECKELL